MRRKGSKIGDQIVEGLRELTESLENKEKLSEKFTVRTIKLDLKPTQYGPEVVRHTRSLLNASQAVFAQFFGVSYKTVQAWEQGTNPVPGPAARLMDDINGDPERWIRRLRELAVQKTSDTP